MKQALLSAVAILVVVVLLASFQVAQARPAPSLAPQNAPSPGKTILPVRSKSDLSALAPLTTTTPSATPTATATATATVTPTTNPCTGRPDIATLLGPKNQKQLNSGGGVTLRWSAATCAKLYRIVVRRGAKKGALAFLGKTRKTRVTTTLTGGYTYYWYVKACNGALCSRSSTWSFSIAAPPTPIPPTPGPTGQPSPPPNGTPVPGNPPPQIAVYKGASDYLNTDPNQLYRFDCGRDYWLNGVIVGQAVYNIALWYYPNERITYQRVNFNLGQVVETRTLVANNQGYVSFTADTTGWVPDHYHLLFTGQSSNVLWCGHFDVVSAPGQELPLVPHSAADVERVYRAAGIETPK